MSMFRALRGIGIAACLTIGLVVVAASSAMASGIKICLPEKEGAAIETAKAGVCKAKYTLRRFCLRPNRKSSKKFCRM